MLFEKFVVWLFLLFRNEDFKFYSYVREPNLDLGGGGKRVWT